jgi:UDP-GlcNAc:undecaprenyl-phosphate/decaprenyl-phosphate GlcNAc-1-phosphate transferase
MTSDPGLLALVVLLLSTALSAALIFPARAIALRLGVIDNPGRRKVHSVPTPRSGGMAVFASFILVVAIGYSMAPHLESLPWIGSALPQSTFVLRDAYKVGNKLVALIVGAVLAFLVGLADDLWGERFPVAAKAAGQMLAALALIAAGVTTSFLPYQWMNVIVTLLWLFGMTNAFNLLDNMDGLAAGVAFVAALVLLINAWSLGEIFISLILVAFMGSLLGFLVFNAPPARIFLGDCGSLFIGYVMGSLTLLERYVTHASGLLFPILMPVLVLAVPLVDTATVVFIRLREKRPIYVGDDRHLSHRLTSLGFSRRRAVSVLYLLTFSLGLGAAALTDANLFQSVLVLLQTVGFVAVVLMLMFVERPEPPPGRPPA